MKQQIGILGSTGSIGTQALDVVRQHPDRYEVYALTANNSVDKLVEQAREFHPAAVVVANEDRYEELKQKLSDQPDIKAYAGKAALNDSPLGNIWVLDSETGIPMTDCGGTMFYIGC